MEVRIWTNQLIHIIDIEGTINLADANRLKELVMKMIEKKAERFIINAAKIDAFDSNGMGAFIFISSTLKKLNLTLAFVNITEQARQVFDKTKLTGFFPIYDDLREAIREAGK